MTLSQLVSNLVHAMHSVLISAANPFAPLSEQQKHFTFKVPAQDVASPTVGKNRKIKQPRQRQGQRKGIIALQETDHTSRPVPLESYRTLEGCAANSSVPVVKPKQGRGSKLPADHSTRTPSRRFPVRSPTKLLASSNPVKPQLKLDMELLQPWNSRASTKPDLFPNIGLLTANELGLSTASSRSSGSGLSAGKDCIALASQHSGSPKLLVELEDTSDVYHALTELNLSQRDVYGSDTCSEDLIACGQTACSGLTASSHHKRFSLQPGQCDFIAASLPSFLGSSAEEECSQTEEDDQRQLLTYPVEDPATTGRIFDACSEDIEDMVDVDALLCIGSESPCEELSESEDAWMVLMPDQAVRRKV